MKTTFLRDRSMPAPVLNIELFFDLVFVVLITQLSEHLLGELNATGALQTAILFGWTWLIWVYTAWATNFMNPDRVPTRIVVLLLMLGSLVMASRLTQAFGDSGMTVAIAFASMHVGLSAYGTIVLEKGSFLKLNYTRITVWCVLSSSLAIIGALTHGHARELLWALVIVVDLAGAAVGFYAPGLGRSLPQQWSIDGGHFAERCQLFVIIALGESIVAVAEVLTDVHTGIEITTVVAAVAGAALLWWVYFDVGAGAAREAIEASADPGRLGRSAYHGLHPIIIAGIIVTAAADKQVLHLVHTNPHAHAEFSTVLLLAGGTALFLLGHTLFCTLVWRTVAWTRIAAVAAMGVLLLVGTHLTPLMLGLITTLVLVALCACDRLMPATAPGGTGGSHVEGVDGFTSVNSSV